MRDLIVVHYLFIFSQLELAGSSESRSRGALIGPISLVYELKVETHTHTLTHTPKSGQ